MSLELFCPENISGKTGCICSFEYVPLLFSLIMAFILIFPSESRGQIIPAGSLHDEFLRIQALMNDSTDYSFVNRPVSYHNRPVSAGSDQAAGLWNRPMQGFVISPIEGFRAGLNPFVIKNTFNSRLPNGQNNDAAWYGRGYNTEFRGGFFVTSKFLTINFYPHLIYQENRDFLHPRFISRRSGEVRYLAEGIGNELDAPFRFGPDPFSTFDLGASSIRFHFREFETGISSEPLWWGGAVQYPLVMSNNAPGIHHAFIGTREKVKIPYLGYFQFRWILGYPEESGYYRGTGSGQTRFTNAANFAFSPPFLKHLTIGLTRVYHLYETDGFDIANALVMFDPVRRSSLVGRQGPDGTRQRRNQTASFYAHLHLPEANAEIYGEFYREDHSYDFRDYFIQPHHNSAYAFGFQKISYIPWFDIVKTNLEFTNLTSTQLNQVRPQTYFYTHSRIRQGHTNRGQILGAAIGPGSNSQYIGMDGYKDSYKVGFSAQRIVVNDNFHFEEGSASVAPSPNFGDYFRHRVDLNFGLNFLYGPGPFYLQSRLVWTKAFNYGRFDYGNFRGINVTNYEHNDRTNVQFQIGITYVL